MLYLPYFLFFFLKERKRTATPQHKSLHPFGTADSGKLRFSVAVQKSPQQKTLSRNKKACSRIGRL
jgi:hypothetical protein